MDNIQNGLKKISEDIKVEKNKNILKKILIPLGITAGLAAGVFGAKKIFTKTPWRPGQREGVVNKLEEMFKQHLKKGAST